MGEEAKSGADHGRRKGQASRPAMSPESRLLLDSCSVKVDDDFPAENSSLASSIWLLMITY